MDKRRRTDQKNRTPARQPNTRLGKPDSYSQGTTANK